MKQIGLIPSGCAQNDVCLVHSSDKYLFYASSVAIYVLNAQTYVVEKILNSTNKHISCFSVSPHDPNQMITVGTCGQILLWNVEEENVTATLFLNKDINCLIAWDPFDPNGCVIVFRDPHISVCRWDISFAAQSEGNGLSEILCIRNPSYTASSVAFSPYISGLIALGLTNGTVNLIDKVNRSVKSLLQQSNKANMFANAPVDETLMGALNLTGPTPIKTMQAVTDLQFDTLSAMYLLVSYQYYIILWDIETKEQMHIFDKTATLITSISWLPWTSGNFVVTNAKAATLSVYNVSQKQPIETVKLVSNPIQANAKGNSMLSSCGVHAATVLNNRRGVWCSLMDGCVLYFNLQRHQLEFQSSSGHTDTIFEAVICPHTPDILASVSYDQTIKVWNLVNLSLVDTIDVKDGIVYSIDWNIKYNMVAVGTQSGSVFIYEMDTGKLLASYRYHKKIVSCVRWSKLEPDLLLSSSNDGSVIVNETNQEDLYEHRNNAPISSKGNRHVCIANRLEFTFNHSVGACGSSWHPFDRDYISAAFFDGSVRVWNYRNKEPLVLLSGHDQKVFMIQWSPLKNGLVATSSDDLTIGIWNVPHNVLSTANEKRSAAYNPRDFEPVVIKPTSQLRGHKSNVRALCWSSEHRRLLISGSWDATMRVWDVITSTCVAIVEDHASDIYAIVSHKSRPFQFISTSRDNTIRIWQLPLVSDRMRAVAVWHGDIDRCVPSSDPFEPGADGFDRDDEDEIAEFGNGKTSNSSNRSGDANNDDNVTGAGVRNMNWMHSPSARRAQYAPGCDPWTSFSIPLELSGAEGGRISAAIHNMYSHYKKLCTSEAETAHHNLRVPPAKHLRKLTGTTTGAFNAVNTSSKNNSDVNASSFCNFNRMSTNECLVVAKSYQAIFNFFAGGSSGIAELWEAVLMLLNAQSTQEDMYLSEHLQHKENVRNALRLQRQEVDLDPESPPLHPNNVHAVPPTPSPKSIINALFPGNISFTTLSRNVKILQTQLTRQLLLEQEILGKARSEARQAEMNKIIPHSGGQGRLMTLNLTPHATPPHSKLSNKVQDQLKEAALMHVRSGEFKKYCAIMIELNEWQLALSIAPAVSIDYWREVSMSYAQHVINTKETEQDCVPYIIAAGLGADHQKSNDRVEMDEAVRFYLHRKEYTKAMVVAKAQEGRQRLGTNGYGGTTNTNGIAPTDREKEGVAGTSETLSPEKCSPAMRQIIDAYAASLLQSSQPYFAAAQYICVGETDTAISILTACGAHDIAFAVARCFNCITNELIIALADMMACRGDIKEALEVLHHLDEAYSAGAAGGGLGGSSRPASGPDSSISGGSGSNKITVAPIRGQSPGPGRPGASVSFRMREIGLLLCRYCDEEETNLWLQSDSVRGGLKCATWTARAEEESTIGCDLEACFGFMLGKTNEEAAVELSTAVLKKNLRGAWGSSRNLADFIHVTKHMHLCSQPCPGFLVSSAQGAALDPRSSQSHDKALMMYLLWYCAHNAALQGCWEHAWRMLRILKENIQMYAPSSFKALALSSADVFIQELRFHILGGDVEGTLPLLNQLLTPKNGQTKYIVPEQVTDAAKSLLELVENSIMVGNVNQGINGTGSSSISTVPTGGNISGSSRPGSSRAGASRPPGNIHKWGDNSTKILRLTVSIAEIMALPSVPNNAVVPVSSPTLLIASAAQGSNYPVRNLETDNRISMLSLNRVQGVVIVLDDDHSVISQNEALLWARFFPFTPLLSGELMSKFIYF